MSNITSDKEKVDEMKLHMLMLMNAWMILVLMKCKCQRQCLTLGCYMQVDLQVIEGFLLCRSPAERVRVFQYFKERDPSLRQP